ncbi:cupin domain-containing protein [Frateuria aurantia]
MKPPATALLSAADVAALPIDHRVHDLNANAIREVQRLGDATGLNQLGVNIVTLRQGHASSEYHRHLHEEEAVYVLSGHGMATLDEVNHPVTTGDFLGFAAGGPAHVITQVGDEPLVLLVFGQRLQHDVCDYPRRGLRLFVAGEVEAYVPLPGASSLE